MGKVDTNQLKIDRIFIEYNCKDCNYRNRIETDSIDDAVRQSVFILTSECPICGSEIRKQRKKKYGVEMFPKLKERKSFVK